MNPLSALYYTIFPKRKLPKYTYIGGIYESPAVIPYLKRFDIILDEVDFSNKRVLDAGATARFVYLWPKSTKKAMLHYSPTLNRKGSLKKDRKHLPGDAEEEAMMIERMKLESDIYFGDLTKKNQAIPAETFDYITALDVLEHIQQIDKACKEIRRMLKKDGMLIASYPTENIWYVIGRKLIGFTKPEDHYRNAKQLDAIIQKNGFKLVKRKKIYPVVNLTHVSFFKKM